MGINPAWAECPKEIPLRGGPASPGAERIVRGPPPWRGRPAGRDRVGPRQPGRSAAGAGADRSGPEMAVPFYDNLEATPIDDLTCLVEVERVYGLDWDRFGEGDWRGLARI